MSGQMRYGRGNALCENRCIMAEAAHYVRTEELQGTPEKEPGTCALIPCQARVTPE